MTAAVSVVQIPLGALLEDSLRLASVPVTFFLHSLAGVLFGVLGPLQFVRALRLRFETLHRLAGRVFVLAGTGLALLGLAMLLQVESIATELLDVARGSFGLALLAALVLAAAAARARHASTPGLDDPRLCHRHGNGTRLAGHVPHLPDHRRAAHGAGLWHRGCRHMAA